jgi:hypothetical protein
MHHHLAPAEATAVEVELHVGMIRQQRHWHGAVGNAFCDHQRGQPLAAWVVKIPERSEFTGR